MNSYSLLSALVMGSLLLAPPVGAAPVVVKSDWRQIKPPPLHAMKPQQPVRVVLDNGIVLLLQQDKELPLMTMNVMIRGGVKDEPFDKTGLSDIFAESWRSGGTKSRTGDQIDDFLALRAAQIETGSEATRTTLTTHCLYFFGAQREQGVWRIGSIRQKVLMSYGESAIHKGIAKR